MLRSMLSFMLLATIGLSSAQKKPNVIVIMADDQDLRLNSMSVMPNVREKIAANGVFYEKHYCTVAWCCPSRVNFLTGKAAHNTNVTGLSPPYGGWPKFLEQGLNQDYLPVWLQKQNINTYYIGKLMNAYGMGNFQEPYPNAWTDSSFLVDPWTYNYHKSRWTNQQQKKIENHSGEHTTDVTQEKALKMLERAAKSDEQFFMMVAPVAPHVEIAGGSGAPPAPRGFGDKFTGEKAPRLPNFNPDERSGASWVHALKKLNDKEVGLCDKMHVKRLQNINALDHMVGLMIKKLQKHKILDNTYIIYTSDNGFHIGNHRMKPGKRCGYEEDINVPFIVRGPDVPHGVRSETTNSHTDVAPTILKMMGVPLRQDFDGQPIAYTKDELASTNKGDYVNVEYWDGVQYGWDGKKQRKNGYYDNGTFKALRMKAGEYSFLYSVWCTNEHEFYDMNHDYYQMNNRLAKPPKGQARQYYGRPEKQLFNRLDALLMVLKTCKQDSCRNAWNKLFPGNMVNSLEEAMKPKYDKFFAKQPKVRFAHCIGGEIRAKLGPQNVISYKE